MWPFKKSAATTIKQAGDMLEKGWSNDLPVHLDETGTVTARCAATAVASVPRGNPSAWRFLAKHAGTTMMGLAVINKDPSMTKEKMLGVFRAAEADARAVGA